MSFFLAEISALKLDKHHKQMAENLVRSFSCASEEERGAPGGEHSDSPGQANEIDFILVLQHKSFADEFIVLQKKYEDLVFQAHKSPSSDTPSQPPEA